MYLIVGLGNPEEKYSNTRHNMGFMAINEFAKRNDIKIEKNKFKGLYEKCNINDEIIYLLKPQTYMNLSGKSILEMMNFFKIEKENLIIIYDDIDIDARNY